MHSMSTLVMYIILFICNNLNNNTTNGGGGRLPCFHISFKYCCPVVNVP